MVVLLLFSNGQHQIGEVFALPGILLADKHSASCGKVAELGKVGRSISDQFKATSDALQIETDRFGRQLDKLSQSGGEQASEMVEKNGKELRKGIEELKKSGEPALEEHEKELSDSERQVLRKVAVDLEEQGDDIKELSLQTIARAARVSPSLSKS